MSGRKDYSYSLSAARAARRAADQRRRLEERARKTRARLKAQEKAAKKKAEKIRKEQERKTRERLAEAKRKAVEAVARAKAAQELQRRNNLQSADRIRENNKAAQEHKQQIASQQIQGELEQAKQSTRASIDAANAKAESKTTANATGDTSEFDAQFLKAEQMIGRAVELGIEVDEFIAETVDISKLAVQSDEHAMDRMSGLTDQLARRCNEQEQLHDEFTANLEKLVGWRETLGADDDVKHFARTESERWGREADSLVSRMSEQSNLRDALSEVQNSIGEAESIQEKAGNISDRFNQRNQVLGDIIQSLKEVGFFVDDPEYADPNSPDGAVIVRASRADQVMTAEVGLDQQVRSDWQGIGGEYCTSAFFDYVKAMNDKGIDVTPHDPNLKPILIEKGEKDLPGSGQHRAQGDQ